ncbi:hypothetical protein SAMN06298212_10563 [Ruaniaceae bacterium KH17]|nr:hypothetical protein SAMN06298212_10563 [Ruaniaceae bacterium KH17]
MNIPTPPSLRPITATDTDLPEWAEEVTDWYLDNSPRTDRSTDNWVRQVAVRRGPDLILSISAFQDRKGTDGPVVTAPLDVEIAEYVEMTRSDLSEIAQGCRDLMVILTRIEAAPMD